MFFRAILAFLSLFLFLVQPSYAAVSGHALLTGKAVEVKPGKNGTVLVFLSANCPCSNNHVPVLRKLAEDFKDFSFVAVHSNADEPTEMSKAYFETAKLPFPVLQDEKTKLADEYHAFKTPHSYVLSPDGKILYKGGVTSSASASASDKQYLRDALSDVSEGKALRVSEGRTLGCVIAR